MRRAVICICVLVLAVPTIAGAAAAPADDEKPKAGQSAETAEGALPQTTCPVTGKEINRRVYVDYNDKRIYFCSPECIEKFKEDAKGFIKRMEKTGVVFEKAPERETEKKHELTPGEDRPHDHRHH